ncbi:hypothetical protein KAR91_58410 [Candidatus Pacearchaeota archaeon]|nr:hypothetical protein [Candidatus Pacearchaeota archaeon]
MKLIAFNIKTGVGCFECSKCEHLTNRRRRIMRRCAECGHTDIMEQRTYYNWRRRRVGYSRLIPTEQIKQARASMYRAAKHGMRFKTQETFSGMRITVEIEMRIESDPRGFI